MKKRTFIKLAGTVGAGMMIAPLASCGGPNSTDAPKVKGSKPQPFLFEQEPLGYDFAALSPAIDPITMEIHYGKHHAGYVAKLNRALRSTESKFDNVSMVELLQGLDPSDTALRNNGGGHYNHTLYWRTLTPGGSPVPEGDLEKELVETFGSLDAFQTEFATAAATRFGSGWAWLLRDNSGALKVTSTPNQDNPLMDGIVESTGTPLLGIDVWEHAYYLNYQNNRKAYISAFMGRINWDVVSANDQA
jgi:Fe-Mn family superoxide dismutase